VAAFAQLGVGDARVNQIASYLGGGLALTAPLASRPLDELGLAIAWARTGSHYERAQSALGAPAHSEATVELTYLALLASWIAVQPDIQYVHRPGNAPSAHYSLVPGLRIALSH
jgi:porin